MINARCWVSAGADGGGAIACVELEGDIDATLEGLMVKGVGVGCVRRRSVPVGGGATDDAVIARWSPDRATVMTHGGRAVTEGFIAACGAIGVQRSSGGPRAFIEAADDIEALVLDALSRAQSNSAVDLLLDQPRRWRAARAVNPLDPLPHSTSSTNRDTVLRRLIQPALVVAVGPPNIGKSSLLNALAGRGVAVVADSPGTTRDHVGALIDLAGVVVRWVDTPGLEEWTSESSGAAEPERNEQIQRESQQLAREIAARADVLVVCRDASAAINAPPTTGNVLKVGLRSDLGGIEGVDVSVSVRNGTGLEELVTAVRETAIPRRWMEDEEPWVFWETGRDAETPHLP